MAKSDSDLRPSDHALQRLIAPYSTTDFISAYWEQTYLHVPRDSKSSFADLITVDDVDHFLATICGAGPQRADSIRLSYDGMPIPAAEFQSNQRAGFADFDADRILSLFRNGATLIINSVQQTLIPIARLCTDLSAFFGVRVLANVYVTPPNSQGFPAHHDNHDVFLLQILGEKSWNIFGAPELLSRWASPTDRRAPKPDLASELTLRTGEVLYIPRGVVHEGRASKGTSFHVTVGIHPYTWAQLLTDVVAELQKEEVPFRRSVAPCLASPGSDQDLEDMAAILVKQIGDGRRLLRLATEQASRAHRQYRIPIRNRLRMLMEPPELVATTAVHVPIGVCVQVACDNHGLRIMTDDKLITLPAFVRPQLEALLDGHAACAADLPPGLDEDGRLVLIRRLVREGVLEPVD